MKGFVSFLIGAAIGSGATYIYIKHKYEKLANDEIEEIRSMYRNREVGEDENIPQTPYFETSSINERVTESKQNKQELNDICVGLGYKQVTEEGDTTRPSSAHVIDEDDYGQMYGYEAASLDYYQNGYLTDNWGTVIEDPIYVCGLDFEKEFQKGADVVYVRNDTTKTDYEIVRNLADYPMPDDDG